MYSIPPWSVDFDWRDDGTNQIISADGLTICFMSMPSNDDNALLIAASPTLLTAAKAILDDPHSPENLLDLENAVIYAETGVWK